jgi:hypothetical protein
MRAILKTTFSAKSFASFLPVGKRSKNGMCEAVPKLPKCHPELVSGSRNKLNLLDAEPSSA